MPNLQALYHEIERLSLRDLEALKRFIEMREDRLLMDKLASAGENRSAMDAVVCRIQDGSASPELRAMYKHLQEQAVDPEDLKMFEWINKIGDDDVAGAAG